MLIKFLIEMNKHIKNYNNCDKDFIKSAYTYYYSFYVNNKINEYIIKYITTENESILWCKNINFLDYEKLIKNINTEHYAVKWCENFGNTNLIDLWLKIK